MIDLSFSCFHTFSKLYTQSTNRTQMPHISYKMKHCIQDITTTSQKQTFATPLNIILIIVRFVCYVENWCVVFMKIETVKGWELVSGLQIWCVLSTVWVSAFRKCVKSNDFVCIKQLKKNCKQYHSACNSRVMGSIPVNADDSVCF